MLHPYEFWNNGNGWRIRIGTEVLTYEEFRDHVKRVSLTCDAILEDSENKLKAAVRKLKEVDCV